MTLSRHTMDIGQRAAARSSRSDANRRSVSLIAVGVNGYPEGRDAVVLGEEIARATNAELMLVAVHSPPIVVLPREVSWTSIEKQARETLAHTRDALAPDARLVVETDLSVARALRRVVRREHRDLLIVGSSRHAAKGQVLIGKRTRQLLGQCHCALGIAPSGLSTTIRRGQRITRVGVGYDGGPEAHAALELAGALAVAAGAKLHICAVVDDRLPVHGWSLGEDEAAAMWSELLKPEVLTLGEDARRAGTATGADTEVEILRGRPADPLLDLSKQVDLLVIGSRRWGPAGRVLLGSTGEALVREASCAVVVTPRPESPVDA